MGYENMIEFVKMLCEYGFEDLAKQVLTDWLTEKEEEKNDR